jgi:alkaline phosphatase D
MVWFHRMGSVALAALLLAAAAPSGAQTAKAKKKRGQVQYKGISRDNVTRVAAGKLAEAIRNCEAYLAENPGDLESLYVLAVAHARRKEPDQAMAYVKKAVEAGLPVGRFHAGPRSLLKPLTDSEAFRAFAAQHPVELIHGPVVGSVTDSRARFWVRTVHEVPVQVLLGTSQEMNAPVRSPVVRTRADADFTAVVEVTGLKANTRYLYQVLIDGKPEKLAPQPSFRTFPKPGEKCRFQVGFGGGAGYTPQHERMWDTLHSRKLTAFLTLGDNVYIDTPKVPATQRYCYYRRQSRPEYRRFTGSCPIFAIWDDHDFATNDCLGSAERNEPPWKIPVWRVFRENFVNPAYGGGEKEPGVWFDWAIGDVDFLMLDCRYYRVRGKGTKPTMLGPVQKKWFLDRLGRSKATFKVLASSVPWTEGTKPGSKDTWDGFGEERDEILSFLERSGIEGVFLISADRHRSDAYKTEREAGYPLYEASSSRLTNIHTHGLIKHALFGYNKKCSFGLLTFDTTKADPELTYEVVNIDNEVMHTLRIKRSQLSFKQPK